MPLAGMRRGASWFSSVSTSESETTGLGWAETRLFRGCCHGSCSRLISSGFIAEVRLSRDESASSSTPWPAGPRQPEGLLCPECAGPFQGEPLSPPKASFSPWQTTSARTRMAAQVRRWHWPLTAHPLASTCVPAPGRPCSATGSHQHKVHAQRLRGPLEKERSEFCQD